MTGESKKALEEEARGGFWARRKAAVREAEAREAAERAEAEKALQTQALEEKSDAEILEELGLPEPEALQDGDDFKAFLTSAIPERIRRRALRRLWLTNPALANVDGLIDYGEDYTDAATVFAGMQTTYQVGKGMLEHIRKLAAEEAERQTASLDASEAGRAIAEEEQPSPAIEIASHEIGEGPDDLIPRSDEDHAQGELTQSDVIMHSGKDLAPATARVGDDDGSDGAHPIPGRRRMRFQTG